MPRWMASAAGRYGTVLTNGFAFAGGMVPTHCVLASWAAPARMRGELMLLLLLDMLAPAISMLTCGIFAAPVLARGAALAPFDLAGVAIGTTAFRPRPQGFTAASAVRS